MKPMEKALNDIKLAKAYLLGRGVDDSIVPWSEQLEEAEAILEEQSSMDITDWRCGKMNYTFNSSELAKRCAEKLSLTEEAERNLYSELSQTGGDMIKYVLNAMVEQKTIKEAEQVLDEMGAIIGDLKARLNRIYGLSKKKYVALIRSDSSFNTRMWECATIIEAEDEAHAKKFAAANFGLDESVIKLVPVIGGE